MFVPEFFYGDCSEVEKKLKNIVGRKKTLDKVKILYDEINKTITEEFPHDDFVISLADNYIGRKLGNAYYPFVFSTYITFEENFNGDIINWFKEESLKTKWCQLSALANNSLVQWLYDDKNYSKELGNSICSNWDFYKSCGECFCFMPIGNKSDNKYYFWENNLALSKILFSVLDREVISVDRLNYFPLVWEKYI